MIRSICCPKCHGAGERCSSVSERWHKCNTCGGTGTIAANCSRVRPNVPADDKTPLSVSTLHDQAGNQVEL